MKFRVIATTLAVTALCASAALAAPAQSIGFHGGLSIPNGDWTAIAGTGYNVGFNVVNRVNSQFGLDAELDYDGFGSKTGIDEFFGFIVQTELTMSAVHGGIDGRFYLPVQGSNAASPYFLVGIGAYNVTAKATVTIGEVSKSASSSSAKFGFCAGLGADFDLKDSGTSVGLKAAYHMVSDPDSGSSMDFMTIAVSYNFGIGK